MRKLKVALIAAVLFAAMPLVSESREIGSDSTKGNSDRAVFEERYPALSPLWGATIHQWSGQIGLQSKSSGLDPDFIAAVINAESNGFTDVVSRAGAVGLMGVMPSGPGLEWRPSPEVLADPSTNLNWGVAILSEIVRQSGGDVVAALAAYSGGWGQVDRGVPQEYAERVLNEYGRAVAVRSNISPNIASQWTVGVEIRHGHIPIESLILSEQPVSGLRAYGH
jgi:soluble lytic murein transglycosylase-like protein